MKQSPMDAKTLQFNFAGKQDNAAETGNTSKASRANREARRRPTRDRTAVRGEGAGLPALLRAQRRHPGNPKAQVAMFLKEFVIPAGTGRKRSVSQKTQDAYGETLVLVVEDLRLCNAMVRNLGELGKAHALHLMKLWKGRGYATGTIEWKLSILRRFLTFIGKPNAIPKGENLKEWLRANGIEPPESRVLTATVSKAWDEKGVDLAELLPKVEELCPWVAIQLEVQAAFGLRVKESIQLIPRQSDLGTALLVIHGTKGGLPRAVKFDADEATRLWQQDVLERAKLLSDRNPKGILAKPGGKLQQNVRHFYHLMERMGITRSVLGVTAHGLRHQYATRRYQQISGMGAPVSSAAPLRVTEEIRAADYEARKAVSRELGHFRPDVTQAYVGSMSRVQRERSASVKGWVQMTEGNPAFCRALADAGVTRAWLSGAFSMGLPVEDGEKLRLIVATEDGCRLDEGIHAELRLTLNATISRGVVVYEHVEPGDPGSDCLELWIGP